MNFSLLRSDTMRSALALAVFGLAGGIAWARSEAPPAAPDGPTVKHAAPAVVVGSR